jgi:2-octaprenyl-6-methoxyphenol hydroxylase
MGEASMETKAVSVDIAIIGAGPAGLAAAIGFSRAGFKTAIADTSPQASKKAATGRSAALLSDTVAFLDRLGVWKACAQSAAPLKVLQFIDDTGRLLRAPDCRFSASEIGKDEFGYNILNADLAAALAQELAAANIEIARQGTVSALSYEGDRVQLAFEQGLQLSARLAIAADGASSPIRSLVGIRSLRWAYDQVAIACSFSHSHHHHDICIEMHRAAGPFTLVPLKGQRSSLVWVERKPEAERLQTLSDDAFAREVEIVSRYVLGSIHDVTPRAAFPLASLIAREYGKSRVALAGEAAHAVPPIGAQGLNLGFRDVETLLDLVTGAANKGEDIGGDAVLQRYWSTRRGDVVSRTLGIDLLNRSLLSGLIPMQFARGLGLYALSAIGPLRRAFMQRGIAPTRA